MIDTDWHTIDEERKKVEAELMQEADGDADAALGLAARYVSEFEAPYVDEEEGE